jgi:hypothetical protein
MTCLGATAAAVAAAAFLFPSTARADDEPPTRPAIVTLELNVPEIAGVVGGGLGGGAAASLVFGVSDRFSAGVSAGYLLWSMTQTNSNAPCTGCPIATGPAPGLGRLDAETRFHALLTRTSDAWIGADVGGAITSNDGKTGPHVGIAAGAAWHFVPAVSVGVVGRAGMYFIPSNEGGLGATLGITLGLHLPADAAPK